MQAAKPMLDRDKIELFFSARQLKSKDTFSESDPKLKRGKHPRKINWLNRGYKNNYNPDWKTQIRLDYIFEISQTLRFEVWDHDADSHDDLIGQGSATVGEIMGSKNQRYLDCKSRLSQGRQQFSSLVMEGKETIKYRRDIWKLGPFSDLFPKKSGPVAQSIRNTVHQGYSQPCLGSFELMVAKLNGGNPQQPFRIECWDNSKIGHHTQIGHLEATLQDIMSNNQKEIKFKLTNPKHKKPGKLILLSKQIIRKPTFIEYLQGGEQINMMIAVDYTGSNGDPKSSNSLHSIVTGQMNQYQQALYSVSQILLDYDYDKKVPIYGFGGVPQFPNYQKNQVDHCFPLTGNFQQPEAQGLEGIMSYYQGSLQFVQLSGPTLFTHIVEYAKSVAQNNQNKDIYSVLLILTDGEIHDMPQTAELIAKCSRLPLSIIIVGVGNEHFAQMRKLDGDDGPIRKQKLNEPIRDLVQFVAYQDHKNNPSGLAQEVLAELPRQLVAYKTLIGKQPNPHQQMHLSQIH